MTTDYELKNIHSDDIDDLLVKVENSFGIKFGGDELWGITTFGQLCEHIESKIQLDHTDDCTSQQAFYKLRDALSSTLHIAPTSITTTYPLSDLLPRKNRRSRIKDLEKHIGFKLNILRAPSWVTVILVVLFLASAFELFFDSQIGLWGIVFSIAGQWFANITGNELGLRTVGEVAEKMARENYVQSRRNPKTYNNNEVEKVMTELFGEDLGIDKRELRREAKSV